jgi:hypothetical protein
MAEQQRFCATCERWMVRTEWPGNMAGQGYHPCSIHYPADGDQAYRAPTFTCGDWKVKRAPGPPICMTCLHLPKMYGKCAEFMDLCRKGLNPREDETNTCDSWENKDLSARVATLEAQMRGKRIFEYWRGQANSTAPAQDYHAPRGSCGSCSHFVIPFGETDIRRWCYAKGQGNVSNGETFEFFDYEMWEDCKLWGPVDGWKDTGLGAERRKK